MADLDELKQRSALGLLVHEQWLFGECRGQAAALHLQFDDDQWVARTPDTVEACWMLCESDDRRAHEAATDSDIRHRVRDIGKDYSLNGQKISNAYQKKLGNKIELCIEFANATDLTLHYNLVTHESSIYFIKD